MEYPSEDEKLVRQLRTEEHTERIARNPPPSKRQCTTAVRFANPNAAEILRSQSGNYSSRQKFPKEPYIGTKSKETQIVVVESDSEDGLDEFEFYQLLIRPLIPNKDEAIDGFIRALDLNGMPIMCYLPKNNGKDGVIFRADLGQALPFEDHKWHGLIDVRKIEDCNSIENLSEIKASSLLPMSKFEAEAIQRWRERKALKPSQESHELAIQREQRDVDYNMNEAANSKLDLADNGE